MTHGRQRGYRYLLGDSRREAARLRAQARLWDPTAEALCARDGRGAGRIWQSDLLDAPLPRGEYDLVFARWVFLFLPDPEAHLRNLVRALQPGGLLAVEDYHRETWAMIPRPAEWSDFIAADRAFFASQGADASIGSRLPELYRRAGLEVVEVVPTIRLARPGSLAWRWMTTYFLSVCERYGRFAPLTPQKARRLRRRWLAAGRDRSSLMIAPAVLDVVGQKTRTVKKSRRRHRPKWSRLTRPPEARDEKA